jgi:hypothetical protein
VTLTQKKSGHQSTDKELSRTSKNITEKKKKENVSATKKNTLFLATSIIESAHYTVTRSGRELDQENFKITYNRLKKLYEELG